MILLYLSTLIKDILAISLIGVGVKRLFNIIHNIIIYRRSRFILITIEVIIMIRYNEINNTYYFLTTNQNN